MSDTTGRGELDRRLNAYRSDLAAEHLRDKVEADRFVPGQKYQVRRPVLAMRERPDASAPIINEALFGEIVWVYEEKDGWAWCQLDRDDYVGYVSSAALTSEMVPATHRISAPGTFIYRDANIKSEPLVHLPLNAQITVIGSQDRFYAIASGGFVVNRHISELGKFARDFVEVAERLIETPYLWGGRSRAGIDCSGLVQVAMHAAGLDCPRDSDMQARGLGSDVDIPQDHSGLARGDLVFWPGHVGIMSDGVMLLHANAHHMAVVAEPLVTAIRRIARSGPAISRIKRPHALAA